MRLATLIVMMMFALAGCANAPDDAVQTAAADLRAMPTEPFSAEGTVFLPPSSSADRVETLIPFAVNATGSAILAHAVLGSKYGPLELPPVMTDVLLELRAPDGTVLAEGALNAGKTEAHLEVDAAEATGEHVLAILSYGGSDGEANGDYVAWSVEATPATA